MLISPYKPKFHVPLSGAIILLLGSIVIGVLAGIIADFISRFFYLVIVFPVFISFLSLKIYDLLLSLSKVYDKWMTFLMAIVIAITCSLTFLYKEYAITCNYSVNWCYVNDLINQSEMKLPFGDYTISTSVNGFINYLNINARDGVEYQNYLAYGTLHLFRFSINLIGYPYWLYVFIETLLFGCAIMRRGFHVERDAFNNRVHQWYERTKNCIGALPESQKDQFIQYLNENKIEDARDLIVPESEINYPKLEIYQNYPPKRNGDVLITLQKARKNIFGKVVREEISKYEAVKVLNQ